MIRQINGKVLDKEALGIIVSFGCLSILVRVLSKVMDSSVQGSDISLWTHLEISERGWDMFGFIDRQELEMFEKLLKIPGVGPKSALSIMSEVSPDDILEAVRLESPDMLKQKGLGMKTAENIVSSLKGKVVKTNFTGGVVDQEVYEALLGLGYKESEIKNVLPGIDAKLAGSDKIRQALILLAK